MDSLELPDIERQIWELSNTGKSAEEISREVIQQLALSRVTDDERGEIRRLADKLAKKPAESDSEE